VPNAAVSVPAGHGETATIDADEVLARLRLGNERFIDGVLTGPRRDEDRRRETFSGQHPVAAVLSCADSRVPVEVIFDQGIGDLFVVRVAGNVAGGSEIASLQYGVEHLNLPLIVVMGHSRCGAVQAAVDGVKAEGPLGELIGEITPAAESVRTQNLPANARLAATVRANVRQTMSKLLSDPVIGAAVSGGRTKLVGAVYDLNSGVIQWVDAVAPSSGGTAPAPTRASAAAIPPPEKAAEPVTTRPAAAAASSPPAAEAPHGDAPQRRLSRPPLPGIGGEAKPPAHSSTSEPHSSAEDSGESHVASEEGPTTAPAAATKRRDNWLVLGSMLTAASGLSIGVIQWLGGRRA
jgi:carbonic anhydrase